MRTEPSLISSGSLVDCVATGRVRVAFTWRWRVREAGAMSESARRGTRIEVAEETQIP